MKSTEEPQSDIAGTLGIGRLNGSGKYLKRWILVPLLLAVVVLIAVAWKHTDHAPQVNYKTQEAQRGDLVVTVTATGNLEPTNQVDVGTEVSGTVESVQVDDNDLVEKDQVLASLDTSRLRAVVLQSRARLASARARVVEARANVKEARNELARLKQVRELSGNTVPSQHDLDAAEAALARALADEAGAEADVSEAEATLEVNETDLSKAVIHSPVNGVVLERNTDPGQTVAASFQAPVLFTLAEDLTKMELHVDVDEADVGLVRDGQEATFTVDAYPDRTFPACITRVRYGSQTVDGVVTYETVLEVDNSDLLLRPGMTATAEIVIKKVEDALLVPNVALRFSPPAKEKPRQAPSGGLMRKLLPGPPGRKSRPKGSVDAASKKKQLCVWALREGRLVPMPVATGATDGIMTEVRKGDVEPGMALAVVTVSLEK